MIRTFAFLALGTLVCAGGEAATTNTNLSVTATASIGSGTSLSATGTATLSGIGSGTFTGSLSLSTFSGPYTITLSGGGGTITGTLTASASILQGSATGSATVTGGTGPYAGATGSFPNLAGTGSLTSTGAINLTFTGAGSITTGGTTGPPAPTISAVLDAASNAPGIAQGSIFIVKGTTLSASGFTSFAPPRPTQSAGVKVTFTPAGGGTGTDAYLVYLYNQSGVNQIAGILPSTVAPGNYNVTVTNGTASAGFAATVVANKLALFTQDSSGTGLTSAQNYISASVVDLNRLTTGSVGGVTISPAHPGQAVIVYGTGLGGYAAGDNTTSPLFDFRSSLTIQAVVGGMNIPVDYAGRAGYAGEDQINFTLPANVPTGCSVSLQISVNGKLSPPTSLAIAPDANATACVIPGYTLAQLQSLDQGNSIVTGSFSITQFGLTIPQIGAVKSNTIGGGFVQLTGFQLGSAGQVNVSVIQSGSCQIFQATGTGGASAGGSLTYLDAGTVTINGPAGSKLTNQVLTKTNNSYAISTTEGLGISIPGQIDFSLPAGSYTLNGGGGPDVGSFNVSQSLASPLTVNPGLPGTVNRNSPLTINWTGGNASDMVEILGSSSTGSGATTSSTTFICLTTAGPGTFTVPTAILTQLPATVGQNVGILEVASGSFNSTFSANLPKIGGSVSGVFSNFIGSGSQVTWQ